MTILVELRCGVTQSFILLSSRLYLQFRNSLPEKKVFASTIECYHCRCIVDIETFRTRPRGLQPIVLLSAVSVTQNQPHSENSKQKIASEIDSSQLSKQHYGMFECSAPSSLGWEASLSVPQPDAHLTCPLRHWSSLRVSWLLKIPQCLYSTN